MLHARTRQRIVELTRQHITSLSLRLCLRLQVLTNLGSSVEEEAERGDERGVCEQRPRRGNADVRVSSAQDVDERLEKGVLCARERRVAMEDEVNESDEDASAVCSGDARVVEASNEEREEVEMKEAMALSWQGGEARELLQMPRLLLLCCSAPSA